jgi:hypothetical protein
MDYGMIGKIDKAKRYSQERERIKFQDFTATFAGSNNTHTVSLIFSKPGDAAATPWH